MACEGGRRRDEEGFTRWRLYSLKVEKVVRVMRCYEPEAKDIEV